MSNLNNSNFSTLNPDCAHLFPELTVPEAYCVHWLAMGLQFKEVSSVMEVSDSMIKKRVKSSLDKLGVPNMTNLKLLYHCRNQADHKKLLLETNRLLGLLLSKSELTEKLICNK